MMHISPTRWLLAVVMLLSAIAARADVVTLHGGRTYEGRIVSETRSRITIDTRVAGIRTKLTLHKADVKAIERKPVPEGFWEPEPRGEPEKAHDAEPAPRAVEPAPARAHATRYLEVPVRGTFGVEVLAEGLRKALGRAVGTGAGHVVFMIDSPGGFLYEAERVADVLLEFSDRLTYHAVVEREAFSAATTFLAASDHIYFMRGGAAGSAVAFAVSPDTGSAEVDAKINAAWASKLAGLAAANGHPPILFRAMILQDLEVYTWSGDGARRYGTTAPEPAPADLAQIDTRKTILALSADDAARLGLARVIESIDDIAALHGLDGWRSAGPGGLQAMRRAARDRVSLSERIDETRKDLDEAIRRANETDPRRMTVNYSGGSGLLSPQDQQEWRHRTDEALVVRSRLDRLLRRAIALHEQAAREGALHLATPEYLHALEQRRRQNEEAARWLRARRDATRISEIR